MAHKDDAIEKGNEIIDKHQKTGLSLDDSKKASVTTVETMLSVGVYPGYKSLYQRTLNYLKC